MVTRQRHLQFGGDLLLDRRTTETLGEGANRLFDGAALAAQLARTPVQGAQRIEDGATDAELGIALELDLLGVIELRKRIH